VALPLTGAVRNYAWGSTTAIPRLLGREPDGTPAAELWLGAHPAEPAFALVEGVEVPLDALLARERHLLAGHSELPFLVKVLAAERALSLQVHPDEARAADGYARGETDAAGLPRYLDPHHKPELVVALTPFRALSGTRPAAEAAVVARALAIPQLTRLCSPLEDAGASLDAQGDAIRTVLRNLLALPPAERARLVDAVVVAATPLCGAGGSIGRYADLAGVLSGDHPGDIGVVAALLLNDLDLAPGDALFQPAGVIHAYVRGTGVEIMASSDNVLRCGLTPKPLDHDGLFQVLDPRPLPAIRPLLGEQPWTAPEGRFTVRRLRPRDGIHVQDNAPTIVLCTEGEVVLHDGAVLPLRQGQAAFLCPADVWRVSGPGEVFVASAVPALVTSAA